MISLLSAPLCLQAMSKSTKVTSRNLFDLMAVNMLAKVADKWLTCHLQCGHPGQGDNTYLRRAWPELASCFSEWYAISNLQLFHF